MNKETSDKMRQLRLFGMYDALKANLELSIKETFTPDQLIALLINSKFDDRKNRVIEGSLKQANFQGLRFQCAEINIITSHNHFSFENQEKKLKHYFLNYSINLLFEETMLNHSMASKTESYLKQWL